MEILKINNVTKVYGEGETKVKALKNVNLSIKTGEFVAIIGSSGSGKSTLLHLIGGLDRPNEGEVTINSTNLHKLNDEKLSVFRRRNIGFIFQFFNLIPVLNVKENILLPNLIDYKEEDLNYFNEIVTLLDLNKRIKHIPSQLSGGQMQRVSIARALINKPSIILADEPTGNLDSKNSKEVMELLKFTSKKYNQTLIVITHDLKIAEEADRIITLKDGEIISDTCKL